MDSTTHTTTTVEFVDWRAKAKEKLEAEDKLFRRARRRKRSELCAAGTAELCRSGAALR